MSCPVQEWSLLKSLEVERRVSVGGKESDRERKRERERNTCRENMLGSHLTVVEYADTM